MEDAPPALLASDVSRKTLDNGLTMLVKEIYPTSVVCISLWCRVGSCYEPDNRAGISHFVEHMLFKGTKNRPVGRIPQEIHGLGGYINGFTTYECTCYWIVLPSRFFEKAVEIQADAVLHPLLEPKEVEKESQVIIEEIRMYQDRPESFCFEKLMGSAYTAHTLRRPITGYEDVVAGLTCNDIVDFYRTWYVPGNMAIAVVGDVRKEQVYQAMSTWFGGMKPGAPPEAAIIPEPRQQARRLKRYRGDIRSAHLNMGFHVGGIFSPHAYACDLLANILGEGRSCRFHQNLREKNALVTSVGASILAEKDCGLFIIEAILDGKNIKKTRDGIFRELQRIKDHGVTSYELQKAKNMVESSYVFSQETVEGLSRKLGYYEMMGDYTLLDRYIQMLYAVTEEEVQQVACTYFDKEKSTEIVYVPRGTP